MGIENHFFGYHFLLYRLLLSLVFATDIPSPFRREITTSRMQKSSDCQDGDYTKK
jgi:hypothetical protein